MKDALTERDRRELLKMIAGTGGLDGALDIDHQTKQLTKDEVWQCYAVDAYHQASKNPINNMLAKQDASKILGLLNQLSNEAILSEYKGLRKYLGQPVDTLQATMATLLHILVERKGLQT